MKVKRTFPLFAHLLPLFALGLHSDSSGNHAKGGP